MILYGMQLQLSNAHRIRKQVPLCSRSQQGQSLIQVMVGAGIMGVLMMAFASMITTQQRETRALTEKLAALNLKSLLSSVLADGSVCVYELNNPTQLTFDSSSATTIAAASIDVSQIHASAGVTAVLVAQVNTQATSDSNTLWINPAASHGIQLTDFQGSGTNYTANWTINFDSSRLVRPLKPIKIPVKLKADNATPTTTIITGCQGSGGSGTVGMNYQVFNTNGSFTIPTGISKILVEAWGGGGGGAGDDGDGGVGGGGGGYGKEVFDTTPGEVYTVVVGGGGTGGAAGVHKGSNGGDSKLINSTGTILLNAKGGGGGECGGAGGMCGAGATAHLGGGSTASIHIVGGRGHGAHILVGGQGGNGGGGGYTAGGQGIAPGGGGGGGYFGTGGGSGATGQVIIWW